MLLKGMSGQSRADRALPLDLRLRAIADRIPASSIDELWVFPPLPDREIACEFVVLICYDGGEDRRRILTVHVDARLPDPQSDEFEWVQYIREQGTAPQKWVADIPDRLLGRLAEAGVPEIIEVGGRPEAWQEVLERFGAADGDGAGNGSELARGTPQVDIRVKPEISFSTVIESSCYGNGSDEADPE